MRTISLVSVTFEGFRSFRAPVTIGFSRVPGFKFVTGRNEFSPSLGANGAGKSSVWEGLTWINFGTSIKDQRASDLTTWGAKRPRGVCVWDIDGERATVERAGNPNYLALNGEPVIQPVIDRLLGRNKKQFVQSEIFGQGAKTFIDLSIPERSAVLDDVLDLGLWLNLSDMAGKKVAAVDRQVDELSRQIAYEDGRLASLPNEDDMARDRDRWEDDKHEKINTMIREVEAGETVMANLIENVRHLENRAKEQDDIENHELIIKDAEKKIEAANQQIGAVLSNITRTQKTISFFQDHPKDCPTCSQPITAAFARRMVKDEREALGEMTLASRRIGAIASDFTQVRDDCFADFDKKRRIRDHLHAQIREAGIKLSHQNALINRIVADIENVGNSSNPWKERIAHAARDRLAIEEQRTGLVREKHLLEGSTLIDGFWRDGFKRVRLYEINRILAHLELEIENATGMLGLFNWHIAVTTETENKSGGTKHGVQIQITSPEASAPWESWSGGEGQRIRLAVALGFANLITRMTATQYTFEVFDEPTSFMSAEGIDDFLACMRNRVDTEHKSVYLIDCGVLSTAGFDEVWCMVKTDKGSHMELIASDE